MLALRQLPPLVPPLRSGLEHSTHLLLPARQVDATARVMAEREVQSSNVALAAEQERMAALVQRQHQLIACLGKVSDLPVTHLMPVCSLADLVPCLALAKGA